MAKSNRICEFPDCNKKHYALGYCSAHHTRLKRTGSPAGAGLTPQGEPMAFLVSSLEFKQDDCIEWPYSRSASGYGRIAIKVDGKKQMAIASRVICEKAYGPPPSEDHDAAHSCGRGDQGCVNYRHLRWKTHAENQAEMRAHGRSTKGERHALAKLTGGDVRTIRDLASKSVPAAAIAKLFSVSPAQVGRIIKRERWAHL